MKLTNHQLLLVSPVLQHIGHGFLEASKTMGEKDLVMFYNQEENSMMGVPRSFVIKEGAGPQFVQKLISRKVDGLGFWLVAQFPDEDMICIKITVNPASLPS